MPNSAGRSSGPSIGLAGEQWPSRIDTRYSLLVSYSTHATPRRSTAIENGCESGSHVSFATTWNGSPGSLVGSNDSMSRASSTT